MADILIIHGILITMDPERRVIENGAIAVKGNRIIDLGETQNLMERHGPCKVIDATHTVVMPGLIDCHAHAGHGLVKTLGADNMEEWSKACEKIYTEGSTEDFWYAEALLSALERLKCGTTCGVSYLGGGDSIMRTDDVCFGNRHCEAVQKVGIRSFLAVGPCRPPFPRRYSHWYGPSRRDEMITFEKQVETCETLIQRWHQKGSEKVKICLMFPVHKPGMSSSDLPLEDLKARAKTIRDLSRKHEVRFTQDGHQRGSVKFAHEQLDLLGQDAFLSHSVNLTPEEIDLCRQTDTKIIHNPSAIMSIFGRCPVPELLDAGVTVALGSDGTAPDRSYDMFRHMVQCMHYHRTYYHDPNYLPPGKALEMVTIDAARALGMEKEVGSLEVGKRADIILVDMFKPHLLPLNMPVFRTIYFANGADVDTVIVNGEILMEKRVVKTVNEAEVLVMAQQEAEAMVDRVQLQGLLKPRERFWGHSKY
jgi:5-methylthioadenosine/S-adenosylhomocysteine deaminase